MGTYRQYFLVSMDSFRMDSEKEEMEQVAHWNDVKYALTCCLQLDENANFAIQMHTTL